MSSIEQTVYRIPNMDCAAEEAEIRHALAQVAGVRALSFRLGARELRVQALVGSRAAVEAGLRAAGFPPSPGGGAGPSAVGHAGCGHDHGHADRRQDRAGAWRQGLLLAPGPLRLAAALALALAAELAHALAPTAWAPAGLALAVAAVLLAGLSTY